jgi:queuine tRNA-ribosyltransferase
MLQPFTFSVLAQKGHARAGSFHTPHGEVKTPVFMPVGTQASVKSLTAEDVALLGGQIVLANTYHLFLRPGTEIIQRLGGLHEFSRWNGPILTDSGGYQVSSLGLFQEKKGKTLLAQVDDDGVTFQSHIDGSIHRLTPDGSIKAQVDLGADIIMAFDESTPDKGKEYAAQAMKRTHRWLRICKQTWQALESTKEPHHKPQALFGIVQGGRFEELRLESLAYVLDQDLPGIALGGESIGGDMTATEETVSWLRPWLPINKPRYAMGLGTEPNDVIRAVLAGIDMFDCVAPSRLARCGLLYSGEIVINAVQLERSVFRSEFSHCRLVIEKSQFKTDGGPIMETCGCYTCNQGYSRAYLHHLFKSKELTYYRLATIHNLYVMVETIKQIRQAIIDS